MPCSVVNPSWIFRPSPRICYSWTDCPEIVRVSEAMEPACIRHTELPGTSRLFADFAYHFDRVARFYRHDPHDPASLQAAAGEVDYPDARRAAIVRTLWIQTGPREAC